MEDSIDLEELDIAPPPGHFGSGRQPAQITAEFVRDLTVADLHQPAVRVQKPVPLAKIRDSHHALARCLAACGSEQEASLITGYSLARISILKADPQFADLLEFYRSEAGDVVASLRERMTMLGLDIIQELQGRFEENPDSFSIGQLRELLKDLADRTGHAPQKSAPAGGQVGVHVKIELSEAMARARARVQSLAPQRTIDHE